MAKQIAQAWPGQYFGSVALADGTEAQGAGSGLLITATTGGIVNLTLLDDTVIPLTVPVGSSIWPLQVKKAIANTATVTSYYNLIGAG